METESKQNCRKMSVRLLKHGQLEEDLCLSDSQQGIRSPHPETDRWQENEDQLLRETVWHKDYRGTEMAAVDDKSCRG